MTIQAIPTKYAGVQFRSRLEARWAAFFDLLRWPWHYEPIDLAGYIPDFILSGKDADFLIEVKPELRFSGLLQHCDKVSRSGWSGEFAIVGATAPFEVEDYRQFLGAGYGGYGAWPAELIADTWVFNSCPRCVAGFNAYEGYYACRLCGVHEGDHFQDSSPIVRGHHLSDLWREAGNAVQWRAP
jgi:hypothetical protein